MNGCSAICDTSVGPDWQNVEVKVAVVPLHVYRAVALRLESRPIDGMKRTHAEMESAMAGVV
jgi:hypothetical protein